MVPVIKLDVDRLRFVFTTDWHLSDQPPGKRTKSYREEIMRKVEFVRDLTQRLRAVGLFGGDMFHQKSPAAKGNTFSLLAALETTLRGFYLGRLFGTHGNHDLWADRVDSIPHQPIGALIASGALKDLSQQSVIFENADGTCRIQVDAFPYTSDDIFAMERILAAPPRESGVTHRILLCHQYGNPGNDPLLHGNPIIGFNRLAACDYDFILWGHDHSRTETVKVGNSIHIRLGSLSRASLAGDEVDRPVAAAVLSFQGEMVGFKEVEIPVNPLEVAFTAANREVEKARESAAVTEFFREMDAAVETIQATDERAVLEELCPEDEREIFEEACQCCGF